MTSDSGKHEEESHLMFKFQDSICLLHMYIGTFFSYRSPLQMGGGGVHLT